MARLGDDGAIFVGPVSGELASGEVGSGRMAEPEAIVNAVGSFFGEGDLHGLRIVVSAGPTIEDLDPVRFLGNRSTGRMGYALAEAALARGAEVTLVSGPTSLERPKQVRHIGVRSARDMETAMRAQLGTADVIIMAAAVADYRPAEQAEQKIKKKEGPMVVELVRNPDILAGLSAARKGKHPLLVGFALETEDVVDNARGKLERKGVELIVANHARDGFGSDDNIVTLVTASEVEELPRMQKRAVADRILDRVRALRSG